MVNKRSIIIFVLLAFQLIGRAQSIIVDNFSSTSSVEARTHKRLDSKGIPCALIKVRSLIDGLVFKEAVGYVENKTNEYWVYIPDKSEILTISANRLQPLIVHFADYGQKNVDTNVTYILSLTEKSIADKPSFTSKSVPSDYQKGAEEGNAEDQCNLGRCYYQGQGVPQNYYTAVSWFRRSAEQNCAEAQYYLGKAYYFGQGFPKPDFEQAFKWYEKSAKNDFAEAQYQLGLCYEKGQGVNQNKKTARKWFEKAAKNGHEKANRKL